MTRDEFLESIRSPKTRYKRVALSPIRYPGGKSLAVGHIVEQLPDVKSVISPFFGGGSVEIALAQKLGIKVVGGDVDYPLVNYWQHQLNHREALVRELNKLKPTKEEYARVKAICRQWRDDGRQLSPLKLATYFYFNHALSYGPNFIGWASSKYLNPDVYKRLIERVENFEADITIKHASFEYFFKKYPNDFFYCDPPYFLKSDDESSKMFKGIYPERNKPVNHDNFNHELLRDCLSKHKGGFILSYNDCRKAREYYKDCQIYFPEWQYTMGQGETRVSKTLGNRDGDHIKQSHELLAISGGRSTSSKRL